MLPDHSTPEPPTVTPSGRFRVKPVYGVILALLCATILKVVWTAHSAGSVDMLMFYRFAHLLSEVGLCQLYSQEPLFNHTPLTAGFILFLYRLGHGDFFIFALLFRVTCALADVAVVAGLLIWRGKLQNQPAWWALALFALSPVSVMISGFHGNVDPIMTAALFFAAMAAVKDRPALCGLLFALACNVKIVPLVLGSVFFFYWLHRGRAWRFTLVTGAMLLAGSALPLLFNPGAYLKNVFGYGSYWGVWGIPYVLRLTGWKDVQTIGFENLGPWAIAIANALKLIIISSILWIGWRKRNVAPPAFPATLGLAWVVFFIFAPGNAVQYMVWLAPFLLLLDCWKYLAVTVASIAFLFVFYDACSGDRWPWFLARPEPPQMIVWSQFGLLLWLTFVSVLIRVYARAPKREEASPPAITDALPVAP